MRILILVAALAFSAATAFAQQVDEATAQSAVDGFISAVAEGDPGDVDAVLAPEFQIVRSNGTRLLREDFVGGFPSSHSVTGDFDTQNLSFTGADGLMVVSYDLKIDETINGQTVAAMAPRLTVFRYIDGAWKVVSHANFATIAGGN